MSAFWSNIPSLVLVLSSTLLVLQTRHEVALAWAVPRFQRHQRHPTSLSSSSPFSVDQNPAAIDTAPNSIIHTSQLLGNIYRIRLGEEDDFLGANCVPTFAAAPATETTCNEHAHLFTQQQIPEKARGLEGALQQGPAFVLDNLLSIETCEELIDTFETKLGFGNYQAGKNFHGALQIVVSKPLTDRLGALLSRHIDINQVEERLQEMATCTDDLHNQDIRLVFAGLNQRWRVYRYAPGGEETFAPHIDAGFPPSGLSQDGSSLIWDDSEAYIDASVASGATSEIVSRLTLLMYLNDDFVGGETKFYQPNAAAAIPGSDPSVIAAVKPIAGSCLVFPQGVGPEAVDYARQHWPLHEGSPVLTGNRPKYVIRSDVLFATTKEPLLLDDPLWKHDHLVRQAFLPATNGPMDAAFLSHVKSLYNPHMGVENISTLLYSLIRFTKKRRIVEIGAGYTSLWILQALKDNEEEMARIRLLIDNGNCKLLDTPWTVNGTPTTTEPALLLCIDNCEHQKETATGACAVAKSLGLDSYLQFLKGDAFDMGDILEEASIDILWCDFGVGSRMKEFMQKGAWASLRPGGLLLCHSTLTNQRTRDWLEAARARHGEDLTGIPADEYVELSLLEPHKPYQNSVSIFQKRKKGDVVYAEPIFSEYA
jgi:predicted O-methyltransferase YrrM